MRVILYTYDWEPITVIRLNEFCVKHLQAHGRVRVPVHKPLRVAVDLLGEFKWDQPIFVDIYASKMIINGQELMLLFTPSEEAALLLKSELLPGQVGDVVERERQAFAKGFLHALNEVCK